MFERGGSQTHTSDSRINKTCVSGDIEADSGGGAGESERMEDKDSELSHKAFSGSGGVVFHIPVVGGPNKGNNKIYCGVSVC